MTRESPRVRLRLELATEGLQLVVRYGRPGGPTYPVSDGCGGLLAGDTDHGWRPARIIEWARALPDSDDSYLWFCRTEGTCRRPPLSYSHGLGAAVLCAHARGVHVRPS